MVKVESATFDDIAADKMWKATGWVMEDPSVFAFAALQAYCTSWERNSSPCGMRADLRNSAHDGRR